MTFLLHFTVLFTQIPPNVNQIGAPDTPNSLNKTFVSYRFTNGLTYPINVGRNIARESATSHFVFASDVELYPSPGMRKCKRDVKLSYIKTVIAKKKILFVFISHNLDLIPRFLEMMSRQSAENYPTSKTQHVEDVMKQHRRRRVYVSAVFEIIDGIELPETKLELVELLKRGEAISFHKWVCSICHTIPKYDEWQKQDLLSGE